eukprot:TRINITY_DN7577_c0_g1_i2.p1 TRINITY_DN7577_c0_g1~~TRINITY_DN7577_c0_g1_i2.p1  ORF type:complete len:671 (+),score=99.32 TRINITY_DN7577_c0_g1_i2:23-2014(+)
MAAGIAFDGLLESLRACHMEVLGARQCEVLDLKKEISNLQDEVSRLRQLLRMPSKGDTFEVDFAEDEIPAERSEVAPREEGKPELARADTSTTSVLRSGNATNGLKFKPRKNWDASEEQEVSVTPSRLSRSMSQMSISQLLMSKASPSMMASRAFKRARCGSWSLVQPPGSVHKVVWDVIGALLIMYDMIHIPLTAFTQSISTTELAIDWLCLGFWTLDMPMTMTVGFIKNGKQVLQPRSVISNYVRGWMVLDMVIVLPDWIFSVIMSSQAGATVRLLRILRLVRVLRLMRLLKLAWLLESFEDMLSSEASGIVFRIIRMIAILLIVNHLLASVWFMVSDLNSHSDEPSWLKELGVDQEPWEAQYVLCFHWAITQFTPSSKPRIQPTNLAERWLAVGVVIFALVGFSYIVGNISAGLSQLRSLSEERSREFWKLRRYLRNNAIPLRLSVRIQRYLEHSFDRQRAGASSKGVKVLSMLSTSLQDELHHAIRTPIVCWHPLFRSLDQNFKPISQHVTGSAMHCRYLANHDVLFVAGEQASTMSFVRFGALLYIRQTDSGKEVMDKEPVASPDVWISEPAVWTPSWRHFGRLVAKEETNLIVLDATKFSAVAGMHVAAANMIKTYAWNYISWLSEDDEDSLSDIMRGSDSIMSSLLEGFLISREPF